ncbi:MAG: YheC/YheD family protein [Alicyclobacillus sp.]|nr:YheC/YheD family protein [Alicyclobacillus sp.]
MALEHPDEPVFDAKRGYFNKWEMYRLLRRAGPLPFHQPVTARFSPGALAAWLRRFRRVYIKPVDGWGGQGVSQVSGLPAACQWQVAGERRVRMVGPYRRVVWALVRYYRGRPCIQQQAAPVLTWQGQPVDFRVHLQRELDDCWVCAGVLARVGGTGDVVSNVARSGGRVWPARTVLQALSLPVQPDEVGAWLAAAGLAIGTALDAIRPGQFEEVGADFGIDRKGQLWLFEVNTNDLMGVPARELFAQLPNKELFERMEARAQARWLQVWSGVVQRLRQGTPVNDPVPWRQEPPSLS